MTDGIKRDPYAKKREDRFYAPRVDEYFTAPVWGNEQPHRVLPWPTAADGDGKTQPPTMDEVWGGRKMRLGGRGEVRLGWYDGSNARWVCPPPRLDGDAWTVLVTDRRGVILEDWIRWTRLDPVEPTTRLTVETTDPEALRRLLGNEHKIVEES